MRSQLEYLEDILNVQNMAQAIIDEYVYIKYIDIWKILRKEQRFFKKYPVFMKYMNEPRVAQRIRDIKDGKEEDAVLKNQPSLFD